MDTLIDTKWGVGGLVLAEIVLFSIFLSLGGRTELLRDSDPREPDFTKRPYSMAKAQLAFWITIIVGCFIYIYFRKNVFTSVVNNTALILLGLSTITTAASAIARPPASKAAVPDAAADHPQPAPAHENFINDIISDNDGMNVHRLQMLIWTVVFGIVFIREVVKAGEFPTYDAQIFGLMGISSATYVWFKRTEN